MKPPEASSRTLRSFNVASSPCSPLPQICFIDPRVSQRKIRTIPLSVYIYIPWMFSGTLRFDLLVRKIRNVSNLPVPIISGPLDPINYLCSITGNQISKKYFTYRLIQIFKILFRGSYSQKSDSPHKIIRYFVYYSTQLAYSFYLGINLPSPNDL